MSPLHKQILAIDLGTSGAKAPVETILLPDGGAEQDPELVWAAVLDACRQALAGLGSTSKIIGVGCCSQYSSVVPVDQQGNATMNMVLWLDKRGAPHALGQYPGGAKIKDGALRQLHWVRVHGIPPLSSGMDSLAHMRFIKLARPEVYQRTACFLEPMDFINLRLTGRAVANPCSAFLMLLVDNRKLDHPRYDPRLVAYSGIDADKLPELMPVDQEVGTVSAEVADLLGLPPGITVQAGINDTQAGAAGSFSFSGSHAGISIGTTSVMVTHVDFKRTDIRNSIVSMPSPMPGTNLVMGENGIGGRAVEHFLEKLVFATDSFGDHSLEHKFAALHEAVANVGPGSGGVLFLPWLGGSMAPAEDGRVRGGFLNMSLETTREHLGRAVLEGVALNFRWVQGAVERFAKRRFSHLVFYSGGAVSDLWAQIIADVTGLPVHQVAEPRSTPCLGVGLLGFQRHGLIGYDDMEGLVRIRAKREPDPRNRAVYDRLHEQFVAAFKANRKIFHALNP